MRGCGEGTVGGGVGGSRFLRSCSSSSDIKREGCLADFGTDDVCVREDDCVTNRERGRPCGGCAVLRVGQG